MELKFCKLFFLLWVHHLRKKIKFILRGMVVCNLVKPWTMFGVRNFPQRLIFLLPFVIIILQLLFSLK